MKVHSTAVQCTGKMRIIAFQDRAHKAALTVALHKVIGINMTCLAMAV